MNTLQATTDLQNNFKVEAKESKERYRKTHTMTNDFSYALDAKNRLQVLFLKPNW